MVLGTNNYETFFNATSREEAAKALQSLIKYEVMNMNVQNTANKFIMSAYSRKFYEILRNNLTGAK